MTRYIVLTISTQTMTIVRNDSASETPDWTLPVQVARYLLSPPPLAVRDFTEVEATEEDKRAMAAQTRFSVGAFLMQKEPGNRDNCHMRACRDVGALSALDNRELAETLEKKVTRYVQKIAKRDESTGRELSSKTLNHIAYGAGNPRLWMESGAWWLTRPGLARVAKRAQENRNNPDC